MPANDSIGFWSYTHRDDELEGGRITRLAKAIQNEFELLTGEKLNIFVDHEQIEWGTEWREVIDNALLKTVFFIPLITPLYLRSEQCRREFIEFVGKATRANARELVLPILYAETAAASDEETEDEVARLVQEIQREDWRTLRFAPESSSEYRVAVNKLATRLVNIAAEVAERPLDDVEEDLDEDKLGILDQVALAEQNLLRWGEIMGAISEDIVELNDLAEISTEKFQENDKRGGGARGRLVLVNQFAKDVSGIADRISRNGSDFSRSAVDSDPGMQVVIRQAYAEAETPEEREQLEDFYSDIRDLASTANESSGHLRELVVSIDGVQSLSRGLRAPMRQLRKGLTGVIDGVSVLNAWSRLTGEVQAGSGATA